MTSLSFSAGYSPSSVFRGLLLAWLLATTLTKADNLAAHPGKHGAGHGQRACPERNAPNFAQHNATLLVLPGASRGKSVGSRAVGHRVGHGAANV